MALTFNLMDIHVGCMDVFPHLRSLYIHFNTGVVEICTFNYLLTALMRKHTDLEEIWIIDMYKYAHFEYFSNYLTCCTQLKSLKKVTLMTSARTPICNSVSEFGTKTFNSKDGFQISFEKMNGEVKDFYSTVCNEDQVWDILINQLEFGYPFCIEDVKLLIHLKKTLQTIHFKELNLSHNWKDHCSKRFKDVIKQILLSPNTKYLKKLSINYCLCEKDYVSIVKNSTGDEPSHKSRRISQNSSSPSTLESVIENSPHIEEIEFCGCPNFKIVNEKQVDTSLSSLCSLKFLKKITLSNVPVQLSGKFLNKIFKSCSTITSLRIEFVVSSSVFYHLCLALTEASSLNDLCVNVKYMPIDKLLSSLNSIKCSKLERVLLRCQFIVKFSVEPLETFLRQNRQLRFLCIIITGVSKDVMNSILHTMNKYVNTPEKVFIATGNMRDFNERLQLPSIHQYQMVYAKSNVSVLDVFNGFK